MPPLANEAEAPPRVSVVIPAHNAEATLPETLASLRAQTLAGFEAIVVDDGSTDGTRALAEDAAAADPRFRVVAVAGNRGVAAARNAGLAQARGAWAIFLDADDWAEPEHLEGLLRAAEEAGADGAVCGFRFAREGDGRLGAPVRPKLEQDLFLLTAYHCPFIVHACLAKRADILELGGFDAGLEVGEDWDLWQRLARAGKRLAAADAATAVYRLRPGSATRRSPNYLRHCLAVVDRAHAPDPRVPDPAPEHAAGRPAAELPRHRTLFLLPFIGTRIGVGADAAEAVALLDPAELGRMTPDDIAMRVASGFVQGAAALPEDVPGLWPEREAALAAALDALGRRAGEPDLGGAVRLAMARRLVHRLGAERLPLTLGELHAVLVNPGKKLADVPVPPGARVLRAYLRGGPGRRFVELPVPDDGVVPAGVLARAVLAVQGPERAWRLLTKGWRHRPTLRRLAQLATRPRGRRFARHLLTLPGGERRPALTAFVAASLPALVPNLKIARPPQRPPAPAGAEPDYWEQIFSHEDPWNYTSGYEQTKYLQTLELLPESRPARALELACAEGHFTAQLAPRVGELLATDISPTALGRAEERCKGAPNVRFQKLDLAGEPLPGRFDLIVASEVFYYLRDKRELAGVARKIADALLPGGHFLTAHASLVVDDPTTTGFDWPEGFGAATINATFAAARGLEMVRELRTPLYRIGLFRKVEGAAKARPEILEREPSWPENPGVAGQINRGGAALTLRDAYDTLVTRRLPILMYHRVAADGPSALAPYRVHPERFEAQLDWLKRHGFRSVGLDVWLRSVEKGFGELPGRVVCITFDDGYEDFAREAWPLLKKYGFGATMFLVPGKVGGSSDWDAAHGPPAPLMDWAAIEGIAREGRGLRRLGCQGIDFGSHTCTHPALTRVGPARVVDELRRSKAEIEGRLGGEVAGFAYPYGYLDGLARNAVEAAGYRLAVTDRDGRARYGDDPLLLPRINVAGGDDLAAFARKLDLRERAPLLRRLRYAQARRQGAVRPGVR